MTTSFQPTTFKVLAFDIYATLIDWETGIYSLLSSLLSRLPPTSPNYPSKHNESQNKKFILQLYTENEHSVQAAHPTLSYPQVLEKVYKDLCQHLNLPINEGQAILFGKSIGSWPAFPDTVAAMQELGKYYKLIALSNVDRVSFSNTLSSPLAGVKFDAIFTAQDIGSYKPDLKNFEYLIRESEKLFGNKKDEIWMVAQSLAFDHIPAKEIGLRPGVWIERKKEDGEGSAMGVSLEEAGEKIKLAAIFDTLGEFADAVEKAFEES